MWIQTLGTTTDGTTRGLREFKLQIFIVLQMGDIQKEQRRDNKIETRGKILLGVQRRGKNKNHLCSRLISWLSQNIFPPYFCV